MMSQPQPTFTLNPFGHPSQVQKRSGDNPTQPKGILKSKYPQQIVGAGNAADSSRLIVRVSLRKPLGIVFAPIPPDPSKLTQQRGVRICHLPRTGAASLAGNKLKVGDVLLSINGKNMRLSTYEQIMDFIILADKDCVNLLFERPIEEKQTQQLAHHHRRIPATTTLTQQMQNARDGKNNSVRLRDDRHEVNVDERRDDRDEVRDPISPLTLKASDDGRDSTLGERDRSKHEPIESGGLFDWFIGLVGSSVEQLTSTFTSDSQPTCSSVMAKECLVGSSVEQLTSTLSSVLPPTCLSVMAKESVIGKKDPRGKKKGCKSKNHGDLHQIWF